MKKRILLSLVSFFAMTAMWANIQKNWNVYATADANGQTWGTATLTLNLKNAEPVVNYWECTLELPLGVTFESATVISTRCPEGSNPELTTTPNSDGTVFISCELEENYAFTGTDGAVVAVTVAIAGDAPLGTCVVNVKNIVVSRTDGSTVNCPLKEFTWTIEEGTEPQPEYPKGDVNHNGEVEISDVVAVLNAMADQSYEWYPFADVNENGEVEISDVVTVLNLMAGVEE